MHKNIDNHLLVVKSVDLFSLFIVTSNVICRMQIDYSAYNIGNGLKLYTHPQFVSFDNQVSFHSTKNNKTIGCAELDFTPKVPSSETNRGLSNQAIFSERTLVMCEFILCLLKLIELIFTDKQFDEIEFFYGKTNEHMYSFCIKLGFYPLHDITFLTGISKTDLIAQTNRLIELEKRLAQRLIKYKN